MFQHNRFYFPDRSEIGGGRGGESWRDFSPGFPGRRPGAWLSQAERSPASLTGSLRPGGASGPIRNDLDLNFRENITYYRVWLRGYSVLTPEKKLLWRNFYPPSRTECLTDVRRLTEVDFRQPILPPAWDPRKPPRPGPPAGPPENPLQGGFSDPPRAAAPPRKDPPRLARPPPGGPENPPWGVGNPPGTGTITPRRAKNQYLLRTNPPRRAKKWGFSHPPPLYQPL